MEKMCETLLLLRTRYHFNGYIHVKTIPGASDELLAAAGYLADRISVNLELPTETALRSLAPNKTMQNILNPMGKVQSTIASHRIAAGKSAYMDRSRGNQFLRNGIFSDDSKKTFREKLNMQNTDAKPGNNPPLKKEDPNLISRDKNKFTKHILTWENACQLAPLDMSDLKRNFAPAGQSTQMIIGATGESDYTLLQTSQALYQGFDLKRVFYSAYIPLNDDSVLPQIGTPPPLLREHRLYQADWLLRFYGFQADELLSESQPNFNELLDPKCDWALRHLEHFPVEVEKASYATLLRVPGIGPKSASRITYARRYGRLNFDNLKRMGVVLKRALEVIHDSKYLLPDNYETIKATEILAKEGFVVMPYMYPDLNAARDLVNAGAACVMPLGSPIGSNKGICTKEFIQILIDEIDLPIIVDAGIGRPSQACEAMEMGAAAVMANTAIATAGDVQVMAEAFKKAIEAGRSAYLSGFGRTLDKGASASSPLTGFLHD